MAQTDTSLQNRRAVARIALKLPCAFSINDGPLVRGCSRDVSPDSIAINALVHVALGDRVCLVFDSYGFYKGEVARLFEGGFAVKLPEASLAVISRNVA